MEVLGLVLVQEVKGLESQDLMEQAVQEAQESTEDLDLMLEEAKELLLLQMMEKEFQGLETAQRLHQTHQAQTLEVLDNHHQEEMGQLIQEEVPEVQLIQIQMQVAWLAHLLIISHKSLQLPILKLESHFHRLLIQ